MNDECEPGKHKWRKVNDWRGDASVPNGREFFTYVICDECDKLDTEGEYDDYVERNEEEA